MRFAYTILYVPDVAVAVAFYEGAFGLKRRRLIGDDYAELETGAITLAFAAERLAENNGVAIRPSRPDQPAPAFEIALATDDVAAAYAAAREAGATAVAAPDEKPWGQTVAYVRDPNGVLIELCTPMG